jgi:hypothetical protein
MEANGWTMLLLNMTLIYFKCTKSGQRCCRKKCKSFKGIKSDNPAFFPPGAPVSNLGPEIFCRLFMVSPYPAKCWDCITSFHTHYNLLFLAVRSLNTVIYTVENVLLNTPWIWVFGFKHLRKYICSSLSVTLCKAVFLLIYIRIRSWLNKSNKKLHTQICRAVENVLLSLFLLFFAIYYVFPPWEHMVMLFYWPSIQPLIITMISPTALIWDPLTRTAG